MDRHPSISEETTASVLERNNLFYPLRRQFIARAGSRSESNRILILELCHALEEYEAALGTMCRLALATSPYIAMNGMNTTSAPQSTGSSSWPAGAAAAPNDPSPLPRYLKGPASSSLDKKQLDRLADEVDSLVREVVEAVPAFSYSLSQGSYGPLPLRVNNQHSTAPDITIQAYLEQVHILQSTYPNTENNITQPRPLACRTFSLVKPALSIRLPSDASMDIEQENLNMEQWWPNRLRTDLREGLLMDDTEDSPNISLQSISVLPSVSYRHDASSIEVSPGAHSSQLLSEGKRRWREYLQGRQHEP
jgi:hypothetical protein